MPTLMSALPPEWNYDGSSTGQATTECSEVILKPVRMYPSPFPAADVLVLCDTYQVLSNHVTLYKNTRVALSQALEGESNPCEARYGFEQEFFLTDTAGQVLHSPSRKSQKDYYCGVGGDNAIGRAAVEQAFLNCIKAGLNITGMNAEVAPAQWELQIDDYGLAACDGLWMLRFILTKTVEQFGYGITLHPKPLLADNPAWNGSGCHANFSTQRMRRPVGGYQTILETIDALKDSHADDIKHYGEHNELRLSGSCETSNMQTFTFGVGDRSASVRIPTATWLAKCGYLEDRRPASNMDPYVVARLLLEASLK
jgi:glutamine synthetase